MAELRIVSSTALSEEQKKFIIDRGGVFYRKRLLELGRFNAETYAVLDQDDQVLGALNVCPMKLKGISALAHPMLHPHCALFAPARSQQQVNVATWNKRILETLANWILEYPAAIVSMAFPVEWSDMQPMIWNKLRCTVKYTYRIALTPDLAHEEQYSGSLKSDIRKARQLGVEVQHSASAEELKDCLTETAASKGFEVNTEAVNALLAEVNDGNALLRVARFDGKVIGFAITVHDEQSAYYLLGGLSRDHKVRGALGLLLTELIAHYAKSGTGVFDFEGSMLPGVERFFRSFGGDLQPYYVVSRAKWPLNWLLRVRGRNEF